MRRSRCSNSATAGIDDGRETGPGRAGVPRPAAGAADVQHDDVDAAAPHETRRSDGARLPLDVRDWAAERTAYPREVVEMALAHAIGNKAEAAYRRGDLFEKRRKLMEAWANFCEAPRAGEVVPLRAGA